jgi:hypothetical protein
MMRVDVDDRERNRAYLLRGVLQNGVSNSSIAILRKSLSGMSTIVSP